MLSKADREFLEKAMPYLGVRAVAVDYSLSTAKYPDIWVNLEKNPPLITVTETWRRKNATQRRVELVHELLHIQGIQHGKIGSWDFNTKPELDSYSAAVYQQIVRR